MVLGIDPRVPQNVTSTRTSYATQAIDIFDGITVPLISEETSRQRLGAVLSHGASGSSGVGHIGPFALFKV
jgi:hypothetical protein